MWSPENPKHSLILSVDLFGFRKPLIMRYIGMILILLLAFAAYLYRLHEPSYWLDEAVSLQMSRDWDALWEKLLSNEVNMWLYYVQLHFWQQSSQLEFYTRFFSVGFSLLSVAMVYTLGYRLYKSWLIGSISALVMALNPFMLRYAQETRGYSETLFFAALASYLLVRGEESKRKFWWVAYGLCITIGLYLHLFMIWVALAHALWLFSLSKKSWGNWFIGAGVAGMGVLTVLLLQPIFRSGQVDWIPPLSFEQFWNFLVQLLGYSRGLTFLYSGALLLALFYFFKERGEARQRLLWLSFLTPFVATIAVSLSFKSLFIGRYFIMILAPAAILIGLGASKLQKRWLIALFIAATFYGSFRSIHHTIELRLRTPQATIREAYLYLSENADADDIIVLNIQTREQVVTYYTWRYEVEAQTVFELTEPANYPSIWVIYITGSSPETLPPPNYHIVENIELGRLSLIRYEP